MSELEKFEFNKNFILVENINEYNWNWLNFWFDYPQSICMKEKNNGKISILLIRT